MEGSCEKNTDLSPVVHDSSTFANFNMSSTNEDIRAVKGIQAIELEK